MTAFFAIILYVASPPPADRDARPLGTFPEPYRGSPHPCAKVIPLAEPQNPEPTVKI